MKRVAWLDVAKGIGILLVIFGHIFNYGGEISKWIFSFHMPLFFFCSGYLYRRNDSFKNYLVKKLKAYLIPFFVFSILGTLFTLLFYGNSITLEGLLKDLYNGQPECLHVGQLWYLICLLWTCLLFYLVDVITRGDMIKIFAITWLIAAVSKTLPVLLDSSQRLPLKIDTAFSALVFFSLGYLYKNIRWKSEELSKKKLIIMAVIMGIISIGAMFKPHINIASLKYEDYFDFLFFAIIGILMIIFISQAFSSLGFLKYLGENSLVIFAVHSFGLYTYEIIYFAIFKEKIIHMENMSKPNVLMCGIYTLAISCIFSFLYKKGRDLLGKISAGKH